MEEVTDMRIGLLPLYIELYDQALAHARPRMEQFYAEIAEALRRRGLEVETVAICRRSSEFRAAVGKFEKAGVDALVTLHLAYSPSLESAAALAATALPIVVLDTTPTFDYGPTQDPAELLYNHGIHGVQDMCNLLIRNGKPFEIVAGHWRKSDVFDRVVALTRAARVARRMRTGRVGIIGRPFRGMGDFAVAPALMQRTIGLRTIQASPSRLSADVSSADVRREILADRQSYRLGKVSAEALRQSAVACLAVRRWIEQEKLSAFTMCFLDIDRACGLPTVPFLAACKAMAAGIGYAGEGDILTAALVGAMASVYPETTFTEMFCPDWKGNRIFLTHMGEVNPRVLAGKPTVVEMEYRFSETRNPVRLIGCLQSGTATFVNLAPLPDGKYRLILAPVRMAPPGPRDRMQQSMRGWLKPSMPVEDFLEAYSRLGGTHHAALVYGNVALELAAFGRWMGWDVRRICA
jgi:L-arabinose isomerase